MKGVFFVQQKNNKETTLHMVIWIPGLGNFLLVESGIREFEIVGFGIRN